jgi:prepilin signal peptidase PulO-like enzyme (type II secretory pathway)
LVQIFYSVPVIGWLAKDAVHGTDEAKYFFLFNVVVVLAGAIYAFGYPLAITLALIGTGLALSGVVLLTMGDVIDRLMSRPAPAVRSVEPEVVETIRQAA